MINIQRRIKQNKLDMRMLVQVHDDLLFEVEDSRMNVLPASVKSDMEKAVELRIPVVVDMKCGKNWADMSVLSLLNPSSPMAR
jgi:DNA polymerase-1